MSEQLLQFGERLAAVEAGQEFLSDRLDRQALVSERQAKDLTDVSAKVTILDQVLVVLKDQSASLTILANKVVALETASPFRSQAEIRIEKMLSEFKCMICGPEWRESTEENMKQLKNDVASLKDARTVGEAKSTTIRDIALGFLMLVNLLISIYSTGVLKR